jgi:NTP pyrophosphatase (non-canonical NTP hydrolase)
MNFNEFIAKHPGIESEAAAMSLHSYMQGAQDARKIDTSNVDSILSAISCELIRAEDKWPDWPANQFHQACILAEESGEAVRAVNEYYNNPTDENCNDIKNELIQTAAMCVRMIKNLEL